MQRPLPPSVRRMRMWMVPGMQVKRWLFLFVLSGVVGSIGFLHFTWAGPLHLLATRWIRWVATLLPPDVMPMYASGALVMLLSLAIASYSIVMLNRSLLSVTDTKPREAVDRLYGYRALARGPKIVALGGGTGLSRLLGGLRNHTLNTTAVVAISDDGGSSGRLRASLDMIAPGDLVDCYAALSDSPVMARLMLHRFERGDGIEGHTFGNLMLATMSEEEGGLGEAMSDIQEVLRIRGRVFPASLRPATLLARLSDGRTIHGESHFAPEVGDAHIEQVALDPADLSPMPEVIEAIHEADLLVLGPGSLYTSIIPALLVPAIRTALQASEAPLVYVASLMTEPGETDGMCLADHVAAIARHLGRIPDRVLVNSTPPSASLIARYQAEGAEVVSLDRTSPDLASRLLKRPLMPPDEARHLPDALAQTLIGLVRDRE